MLAHSLLVVLLGFTSHLNHDRVDVTVSEDAYGVPSIQAPSLGSACYALGYAQAKDYAERMATNYKFARGRLAEISGRAALLQDGVIRGFGFEKRAADLSATLTGEAKEIVDGFVAGANQALFEQKATLPKWIEPFSPVDILAFTQFVNAAFPLLDLSAHLSPGAGSNQFALSGKRTASRHPILSIDPHLGWDGQDGGLIWQEFALYTPDIHFRGVSAVGLPLGVLGHNDHVAWSMTNNNPQLYTIYSVKTNPENKAQYSYHGQWKDYQTEKVELRFLDKGTLRSSTTTVRSTAWGPIIPFSSRSVRLGVPDPTVTLLQVLRMMRSQNGTEFRTALQMRGLSMWNFVYADTHGMIGYQYNASVAKRDEQIAWGKTVPGDSVATQWGDLWDMNALPHVENPASGILVNCNSDPLLTSLGGELSGTWPAYVTSYGKTTRWERLSAILKATPRVTPDLAKKIATDCAVPYAKETVAQLAKAGAKGDAMAILQKWDGNSKIDSTGCVLYTYWLREDKKNSDLSESAGHGKNWSAEDGILAVRSLEGAAQKMLQEQGKLDLNWGGVQYMERGTLKEPVQGFGYVAPGSRLAAVSPASAGTDTLKAGRSHATFGSSFRMIVSLDPHGIQSWSVLPYGNSSVSNSPHYADQMGLYAIGKYKPTNFGLERLKKNSVKSYHLTY